MIYTLIIDANGKARKKTHAERRAEAIKMAKEVMAGTRIGRIYF